MQVSLRFDGEEVVEPGNNVTLTVTAEPDSLVGLLAIDLSVVLLQDGNDITSEMVSRSTECHEPLFLRPLFPYAGLVHS